MYDGFSFENGKLVSSWGSIESRPEDRVLVQESAGYEDCGMAGSRYGMVYGIFWWAVVYVEL